MQGRSSSGPRFDDFVGRVVADPANPPNAVLIQGFVGASDAKDHIRVYADPSLASYVDVPSAAVIHSVELPEDQSPLGGSMLWIDAAARLRPAAVAPQATAGDFLRGPIQADLGATAAPSPAAPVQITLLTHQGCPPMTASPAECPSLGIACTHFPPCVGPTGYRGCGPADVPNITIGCGPSWFGHGCTASCTAVPQALGAMVTWYTIACNVTRAGCA
jgi:hypothetical protein